MGLREELATKVAGLDQLFEQVQAKVKVCEKEAVLSSYRATTERSCICTENMDCRYHALAKSLYAKALKGRKILLLTGVPEFEAAAKQFLETP